jgi:hypothetical protein
MNSTMESRDEKMVASALTRSMPAPSWETQVGRVHELPWRTRDIQHNPLDNIRSTNSTQFAALQDTVRAGGPTRHRFPSPMDYV